MQQQQMKNIFWISFSIKICIPQKKQKKEKDARTKTEQNKTNHRFKKLSLMQHFMNLQSTKEIEKK